MVTITVSTVWVSCCPVLRQCLCYVLIEHDHGNVAIVTLFSGKRVTSVACPCPSAMHKAAPASAEGDITATGVFSQGQSPQALPFFILHVASVEFPDEFDMASYDVHGISFGASDEDELSIAASEDRLMPSDTEDSAGLPPSGVVTQSELYAELAAMLS